MHSTLYLTSFVKIFILILIVIATSCSTIVDKLKNESTSFMPFLTDKDLSKVNTSQPITNDSLSQFLSRLNLDISVLRIDTSLIKHTKYIVPTVMVYKSKKSLTRNICNANFPGLIKDLNHWKTNNRNWDDRPKLPLKELTESIIGFNKPTGQNDNQVFYFYTMFYDNLVRNQMVPLYKESLKPNQNIDLYFVNIDNHPATNLSDVEFGELVSKHNPFMKDGSVQIPE